VTPDERRVRAAEIAAVLCDHQRWLSHGRPIKAQDLGAMRLKVTDYTTTPDLQSAIWELWVNLNHVLSSTNVYKIYETETVDLVRLAVLQPMVQAAPPPAQTPGRALLGIKCQKCGAEHRLQANFGAPQPLEPGAIPFPKDCLLKCRQCGDTLNLAGVKLQIEAQARRPILL
jgi:hypothetical protein